MRTDFPSAIIAGGGTGGHVIPAIAVADEIIRRGGKVRFIGVESGLEARLVPRAGYGIDFLNVRPLAGGGLKGALRGLASIPRAMFQAAALLRKNKPDVVFGVGGYVAGPLVLAARLIGIKTALLEQNATLGLTNKLLLRFVDLVFVAYADALGPNQSTRVRVTGNPVSEAILKVAVDKERNRGERVFVLVMGGSQGARAIDELVPHAIVRAGLGGEVTVTHQCGAGNEEMVRRVYAEGNIPAEVVRFIDEMAVMYEKTDLVVARAGATTCSELAVLGLPAVLLPYPHHTDRQQELNAEPLRRLGAAVVLDEKRTRVDEMASTIADFVRNTDRRIEAGQQAASLGRPHATRDVAGGLIELAGGAP